MRAAASLPDVRQQLRDTLALEDLARCLYEVYEQQHPHRIAPDWDRLSHSEKYQYRMEATAALARLDPDAKRVARLRAREQMAQNGYGQDYSRCDTPTQARINYLVQDTCNTYDRVLEGLFSPLSPSRRAELEPERRTR
jgi:hypothetical protein